MPGRKLRKWAMKVLSECGEPQVVIETHRPTEGELNNLCYLSMKYIAGWSMREADLAVVMQLGGEPKTLKELDKQFIPQLAEYIWDHLLGEPSEPNLVDVTLAVMAMKSQLYSLDERTRNSL